MTKKTTEITLLNKHRVTAVALRKSVLCYRYENLYSLTGDVETQWLPAATHQLAYSCFTAEKKKNLPDFGCKLVSDYQTWFNFGGALHEGVVIPAGSILLPRGGKETQSGTALWYIIPADQGVHIEHLVKGLV